MFQWIVKKSIQDYQNTSSPKVREKYGTVCSLFSIVCNGVMVVFKLIVGFMTHSVAIQADGFNNLSDMGSNLATLFGFKMASKHPDADHPYGHGRYYRVDYCIFDFISSIFFFERICNEDTSTRNFELSSECGDCLNCVNTDKDVYGFF